MPNANLNKYRHPAAPPLIDLKTGKEGFAPFFRQAMTTNKPVVLREENGTLDARLLDDVNWRGFGDPSRVVVVSPIHPTTGDSTLGFLIMGTNPRCVITLLLLVIALFVLVIMLSNRLSLPLTPSHTPSHTSSHALSDLFALSYSPSYSSSSCYSLSC